MEVDLLVQARTGHRDAEKLAWAVAPLEIAWPVPAVRPHAGWLDDAEIICSERPFALAPPGDGHASREVLGYVSHKRDSLARELRVFLLGAAL